MIKNKFENFTNNNEMNPELEDAIIDASVKEAQEIAKDKGLKIGQVAAHPSDNIAYDLKEVSGNIAKVWFNSREDTIKEFPFDELFDPREAGRIAVQKTVELRNITGSETIH